MKRLLLFALSFTVWTNFFASHIPGANITWQCTGNPNEYIITLTAFESCNQALSLIQQAGTITNTCGLANPNLTMLLLPTNPTNGGPNPQEVSQICAASLGQSDCIVGTGNGLPGVNMYVYQATVTLPGVCDSWTFNFSRCCRDVSINTNGGATNQMYVNSTMNSATAPCDNSPYVTAQANPYVCAGQTQTYCPGAIDPDGDSLYYSLVNPLGANGVAITHPAPYSPIQPLQNLTLDPLTGCITFNEPGTGNFVVTYMIESFDASGNQTGFIMHDFQFEVVNNSSCQPPSPPTIGVFNVTGATTLDSNTMLICEGESMCFDLTFEDADLGDTLRLDSANTNVFAALPGATLTQSGINPITFTICWTVPVGASPNTQLTVGVSDGACPFENTASYPVNINVTVSTVANPDTTICGNQSAQLSAAGGTAFTWYYASTATQVPVGAEFSCNPCANPLATPAVTTDYYVISDLTTGCDSIDSTTVNVVPDFTTTDFGDTLLCDFYTTPIGINVAPAGTYTAIWSPGGTLDNPSSLTPQATPTETTSYVVTVTSSQNCVKLDTVQVNLNPPPLANIVPGDTTICLGESLQFNIPVSSNSDDFNNGFDPSAWSNVSGASTGSPCLPFDGDALNFDDANRELTTNAIDVSSCTTVDFCLYIANANTPNGTNCENADNGEDIVLNYSVNGGSTWVTIQTFLTDDWEPGAQYNNTWQCFSVPIPPAAITTSTLFQWTQLGNYGNNIDNWSLDNISINCGGSNAYDYSWTPGVAGGLSDSSIFNPVATPTTSNLYTVTLTDADGCTTDFSQTIVVVPDYTYTLSQSSANTCLFDPVQLNVDVIPAGAGYSYQWTPSTFLDSDTISNPLATILSPGVFTYYAEITSPGGCVKNDSITISIANSVAPTFTLASSLDTLFCNQQAQFTLTPDTLNLAGIIDDFNNPLSPNWLSVSNGTVNTDCGAMSGNALHFAGTTDREAVTQPQNVATCTTVDFCLFIANDNSGAAPCEDAETGEDVELQYSINGAGGPWITIQVFASDDWDPTGPYNNTWQCFSIPIPPAAQTGSTLFKWVQPNYSNCNGCDNWALDDVSISCPNSPNYTYQWTNGISLDDDTIQNPLASPLVTTTYAVTVTNPNGGCTVTDSLTIYVDCGQCFPSIPTITNVTCKGGGDGQIVANPVFGPLNAKQVVTILDNSTVPPTVLGVSDTLFAGDSYSIAGLSAGSYTVSTFDTIDGGCTADTIIMVAEPDSVDFASITLNGSVCIGGSEQIDATANGGNGAPYTYTWTNVNTGNPIPGNGPHTVFPVDLNTCYSVIATDALGCNSDPRQVCLSLYPNIIANTTNPSLTICPGTSVDINMTGTVGGSGTGYNYEWYDENNNLVGTGITISVTPNDTNTIYTGVATDDCTTPADSIDITVNWFEIVAPDFEKNKPDSCYPITRTLNNTSTPTALISSTDWIFSDGTSLSGSAVTNTFNNPACQDITMRVTTIDGCIVDTTKNNFVCPQDYPTANYSMDPPVTDLLNTQVEFTNLSSGLDPLTYHWRFNSGLSPDTSIATNPIFVFPDEQPDNYDVILTVTDANGCASSIQGTVIINGVYLFYMPNSFTPDQDGKNEIFRPYGEGIDFSQYTMQIFDRWGTSLFVTGNPEEGWNGVYQGKVVASGTYVWKIVAKEESSPIVHENIGHVNVIK